MEFNYNVLLVEDNKLIQKLVQTALANVCTTAIAATAEQALGLLSSSSHFDLILLDIGLPDQDGFNVYTDIRELQTFERTPILFLTGNSDLESKLKAFSLGADDYIVKPFSAKEFRAKISAKLRNLKHTEHVLETFKKGPFQFNLSLQKAQVIDDAGIQGNLELTANQFKILVFLAKNEGNIISRDLLLQEIWGDGLNVTNRTIDSHVYSIRKQLGEYSKYIKSVHGKGYCFSLALLHKTQSVS